MKTIFYGCAVALLLFSCKREKQPETICFDGKVKWYGDPAADGLGWVVVKDDSLPTFKAYIPQNLTESYKVDQLKISVCLSETDEKFYCECAVPMNKYRITSIAVR